MSSLSVVPFKVAHLKCLVPPENYILQSGLAKPLEQANSVTVFWGDTVMLCGGIGEIWPGRGHVWAVFNETSKHNFVPVFRWMKRWLHEQVRTKYRRVEISVDYGLSMACRRAEMLGFKLETERARLFLPDGQDASLYTLVRE